MGLMAHPGGRQPLIHPHAPHLNTSLIWAPFWGLITVPGGRQPLIHPHVPHLNTSLIWAPFLGLIAVPEGRQPLIHPHVPHLNTSLILVPFLDLMAHPGGRQPLIHPHAPHSNTSTVWGSLFVHFSRPRPWYLSSEHGGKEWARDPQKARKARFTCGDATIISILEASKLEISNKNWRSRLPKTPVWGKNRAHPPLFFDFSCKKQPPPLGGRQGRQGGRVAGWQGGRVAWWQGGMVAG